MNTIFYILFIPFLFLAPTSIQNDDPPRNQFSQSTECTSSFNDEVKTYKLYDGSSEVGHAIWINRASGKMKAKYFAHKMANDGSGFVSVHDRYNEWKQNRTVALKSSGAYATGWDNSDVPTGITVDNGQVVNQSCYDKMDGLVIVYATGGIAVSNLENADLRLSSINKKVDLRNPYDRQTFLEWAQEEEATVFQTHLLVYNNESQFVERDSESAKRKFLVLTKDKSGQLYHVIFYMKRRDYALYDAATGLLTYLNSLGNKVIAMVNLDTGRYDNLHTGETVRDCDGNFIKGTSDNYGNMTNLLAYEWDND